MAKPVRTSRRPDGTVVLQPRRITFLMPFVMAPAFAVPPLLIHGPHPLDRGYWLIVAFISTEFFLIAGLQLRRRVVLGPDAITLRHVFRTETIALLDIQAITCEGTMVANLLLWTGDQRSHRVRLLTEADLNVVGDWWIEHRGTGWRPAWGPPPPSAWNALPANPWQA